MIALIVALVMGGSSVIVGGLQALTGLLAVAGLLVIAVLILIARQPVLLDLHALPCMGLRPDPKPIAVDPRDRSTRSTATASIEHGAHTLQRVARDRGDYRKAWGFEP